MRTIMESFNLIVRLDQTPQDILEFVKYRIKETGETGVSLNDLVLNVCGMDEILSRNENKFGQYKVMNLDSELKLKKKVNLILLLLYFKISMYKIVLLQTRSRLSL